MNWKFSWRKCNQKINKNRKLFVTTCSFINGGQILNSNRKFKQGWFIYTRKKILKTFNVVTKCLALKKHQAKGHATSQ